jgi:uncharacterized membrane protein YebE (DUF533 family)
MTNASPLTGAEAGKKPFTDSMFSMWRAVIAVAHADGVIHEKERSLFDKVFTSIAQRYDLTDEQRAVFEEDLIARKDIDSLVAGVTEPECKAMLLFFAQIVASIDGVLAYDEAAMVGQLHGKFGLAPDTVDRVAEIRRAIADQMAQRRADMAKGGTPRNPILYALDALLLRLGVEPVEP